MNILVYSGPGVSQNSLSYTIATLKQLLQPNYVVQSVNPKVLATEPWGPSCALLVIPGGHDLPYLSSLGGPAMATIARYVRGGGSYLGFCAGAYFASGRVEWEMGTPLEVQGDRPLKFFPGPSHGCTYSGFQYESERGARSVSIVLPGGNRQHGLYYNGGGHFVMPESIPGITPLAYYDDNDKPGMVAGVACEVEKGKAALWHVHLEFPANCNLALEAAARSSKVLNSEALLRSESDRQSLLLDTLKFLGLDTGGRDDPGVPQPPSKPLPQLLCGTQSQVGIVVTALHQLRDERTKLIEDANDTFQLHEATTNNALPQINQDETFDIRHIVVFKDAIPSSPLTPHFNVEAYFESLLAAQRKYPTSPSPPLQSPIGSVLLYGEAVTSTQTLLQSNHKILEVLPTPILSLATYQLKGRGRGSNVWASPLGCLQWSLLLRPPPQFPNNKLVFIQYLVGVAAVKACREVMGSPSDGGADIVLKWPNDIYARTRGPKGEEVLRKIGGILVNTVFMAGGVRIIVGCGLNVLNSPPILSLSQLLPKGHQESRQLTMENMAATIMAIFGQIWDQFISASGSFEPFVDLYLDSWIHSDQLVTLETVSPPIRVRIVGITPDHGLLRTLPESSRGVTEQDFIDLQPDGNSFDMMAGLIKTKRT